MRWFLMLFKISKTLPCVGGRGGLGTALIKHYRLVQAQTELEAVAKFKLSLKGDEKYLSHENLTIL